MDGRIVVLRWGKCEHGAGGTGKMLFIENVITATAREWAVNTGTLKEGCISSRRRRLHSPSRSPPNHYSDSHAACGI